MVAAAAQATIFSLTRERLRQMLDDDGANGARANDLPNGSFTASGAVSTLAIAGAATVATIFAFQYSLSPVGVLGLVAAVVVLALFAEVLGRSIALRRVDALGPFQSFAELLGRALTPVLRPLEALADRVAAVLGARRQRPEEAEEAVLDVAEEVGIQEEEREMILGIFELSERTVREIMVPRIDVVAVPRTATVGEVLDRMVSSGHSRIPMFDGSIDNIVGVVNAKDILRHLRHGSLDDPAESLARPVFFVPESKRIDDLLRELKERRSHLAIVVDEYGGTAGLITAEDLLEEIVGELPDEYDLEEPVIERVSEREAIVDARVSIHDVNHELDLELEDPESDTIGGLVYHRLGKVPDVGDEVHVGPATISVLTTAGRRIKKLRVTVGSVSPNGTKPDGPEARERVDQHEPGREP